MTSPRVSTFAFSGRLNAENLRIQTELSKQQIKISTGKVGLTYADTGRATQRLLNVENDLARIESQNVVASNVSARIEAKFATLTNILDLAGNLQQKLAQGLSGSLLVPADVQNTASNAQGALESLLNVNLGGRYLFSGDLIDTPPVDITDPAIIVQAPPYPSIPDTAYYQGDNNLASAEISDGFSITYGVTADHPGFEKLFRAMNIAANNPADPASITEAFDLVKEAVTDIGYIQTDLASKASIIENQVVKNEDDANLFKSIISDISDTDLAATTVLLTQLQTQLEASYSNTGRLTRLKLFNFL
ncbi:MAG: hypothetical protein CMH25_05990 [Micavibrio sp.]|nr:hypothetical protein [Micavibrio sp.]|tara:strand:+ start:143 stop:1057 length:915 start_codon:yes stop_codon:yes gene_type:complete